MGQEQVESLEIEGLKNSDLFSFSTIANSFERDLSVDDRIGQLFILAHLFRDYCEPRERGGAQFLKVSHWSLLWQVFRELELFSHAIIIALVVFLEVFMPLL
jgi:hypothetical protein